VKNIRSHTASEDRLLEEKEARYILKGNECGLVRSREGDNQINKVIMPRRIIDYLKSSGSCPRKQVKNAVRDRLKHRLVGDYSDLKRLKSLRELERALLKKLQAATLCPLPCTLGSARRAMEKYANMEM
jgi:hypothetical protein